MELYQRIETMMGKKLSIYPTVEEEVLALMERVAEAQRFAHMVSSTISSLIASWTYNVFCRNVRPLMMGRGRSRLCQKRNRKTSQELNERKSNVNSNNVIVQ